MSIVMKSVFSSNATSVGYDEATQTLYIEWTNSKEGKVSAYHGVPVDVYEKLLKAPSIGSMIHTDVKPYYQHNYVSLPS